MSWWERQWYKMLTGNVAVGGNLSITGTLAVTGAATGITPVSASGFVTLASLGTLTVTYEDEIVSDSGAIVYVQTG